MGIPVGTGMGKKCPSQTFVGIPAGKILRREDEYGELFFDGEFSIIIPIYRPASAASSHLRGGTVQVSSAGQICRRHQRSPKGQSDSDRPLKVEMAIGTQSLIPPRGILLLKDMDGKFSPPHGHKWRKILPDGLNLHMTTF
jgi:hypothetical protein